MRPFLVYAVLRLALWVVIWWLLTLLDVGVLLAAVLAALLAMLISILFLDRLRDRAAMRWKDAHERRVERRGQVADEDADYEDLVLDDEGAEAADGAGADDGGSVRDEEASRGAAGPAQLPHLSPTPAETPDETGTSPQDRVRGSDR
jgi:hypothetical protein